MSPLRMLFVDDEPSIRLTLPAILRMHGHTVEVAATVLEALTAIQAQKFDVLISDLNIGNAGDGFTVVSAMRRSQPECVTLILTGYPGFESALQAIRSQVDDYLVKPTQVERLVETIERKLSDRTPHQPLAAKRVVEILADCQSDIVERAVSALTSESGPRSDGWSKSLSIVLRALITGLRPSSKRHSLAQTAAYGVAKREQGATIDDLFDEFRALERAGYEVVQENLLASDVSNLVPDLRMFNDHVQVLLNHAINAYLAHRVAA